MINNTLVPQPVIPGGTKPGLALCRAILLLGLAAVSLGAAALDRDSPFSKGVEPEAQKNALTYDEQLSEGGIIYFLSVGLTAGGDEIGDMVVIDNDLRDELDLLDTTTTAGGTFLLSAGLRYTFAELPVQIHGAIGYHSNGVLPANGDVEFGRFPVELMGFYNIGGHQFGVGVTYHLNPKFTVDGFYDEYDIDMENALGFVIEYDFQLIDDISLGLRYVDINYTPDSDFVEDSDIDGSHLGLIVHVFF